MIALAQCIFRGHPWLTVEDQQMCPNCGTVRTFVGSAWQITTTALRG